MCGIFGIGFLSKYNDYEFIEKLVVKLFKLVESRGTDAAGVAFVSKNKIHVVKDGVPGRFLTESLKFKTACKKMLNKDLIQIIGHCRLQTKGSYLHNINNHPIVANSIVGVHNGYVINDDKIFNYYNELQRVGEVDTEAIFRLIDYNAKNPDIDLIKSTIKTSKKLDGDFACAFTHSQKPYLLGLFRKYNPTVIRHYSNDNLIIYSSKESFIDDSIKETNDYVLGDYSNIEYKSKSGIFINLLNGRYNTVDNLFK